MLQHPHAKIVVGKLEQGVDDPVVNLWLSRIVEELDEESETAELSELDPVDGLATVETERSDAVGNLLLREIRQHVHLETGKKGK